MDLVSGVTGSLAPKLLQLLQEEYKLQKSVRKKVEFVALELESIHSALRKVGEVPWDQLDEQVKVWARQVREASYNMEDILDTFLVRVEGREPAPFNQGTLKRALKKMSSLFSKGKARRDISGAIEDIKKQLQEVAERRARYKVDDIVAKHAATSTVDPRLEAMYTEVRQLVGIDKSRDELMFMLLSSPAPGYEVAQKKMKIVSVVGAGGLGKTTLAKAVYDELKPQFSCWAFVPVGRNPDLKKVFRDILLDLDQRKYMFFKWEILDERQLINELRDFLQSKSYFIVIDDIWETLTWEKIRLAFVENDSGSRIITTTRKLEVASGCIYKLQPLSHYNSKKLLYTRIYGEGKCPDNEGNEICDKILKKCDGVPLATITMASLLVGKSREEWSQVYSSIGFGHKDNQQVESTMKIVSFSYYDLPCHLRACLLYLSAFPEDYCINKDALIWKWIAEGFVHTKPGIGSFEVGEGYFNDLVNRSMIQAVESEVEGIIDGCRVHDIILDLLRSLSREEGYITILDSSTERTLSGSNGRRLALQNRTVDHARKDKIHVALPQMRSLIVCGCEIDNMALHRTRFELLRVLALEHCKSSEGCWYLLEHIGNLLHLRYLGIRDTPIHKLPEEIGALKFLETLDLQGTWITELPLSVAMLTQLVCLRARQTRAPDGIIAKLTSLEELQISPRDNDESRALFAKDLGNLGELRVLRTSVMDMDETMFSDLLKSVGNLHKMQHLTLEGHFYDRNNKCWDEVVLPRHLRRLLLSLSSWINPSTSLLSLSYLDIYVHSLSEQGLKFLAGLPELRDLNLCTSSTVRLANVVADGCFHKLRSCKLLVSMVHFAVNEDSSVSFTICNCNDEGDMAFGAQKKEKCRSVAPTTTVMPSLEELYFSVDVHQLIQNNGGCDMLGLEYLPSLRKVIVQFISSDASSDEQDKQEDALRNIIEAHPNRPTLHICHYERRDIKMIIREMDQDDDGVMSQNQEDQQRKA